MLMVFEVPFLYNYVYVIITIAYLYKNIYHIAPKS